MYSTKHTVGHVISQNLLPEDFSSTAKDIFSNIVIYRYEWVEENLPEYTPISNELNEEQLSLLYKEFADEDRELANVGLEDYNRSLLAEDAEP